MSDSKSGNIGIEKIKRFYAGEPDAPFYQKEFWLMETSLNRWYEEGLSRDADLSEEFGFDPPGSHGIAGLGWTTAAFVPAFPVAQIEDRGDKEVVQDSAGRYVLFFKNRRVGFMPEYLDHPVKDRQTWEDNVKWRLDPSHPDRISTVLEERNAAVTAQASGMPIVQRLVGGYMYLRSLLGPEGALYMFYDNPELIHVCMKAWFDLTDHVVAMHQEQVTLDELFLAEDICYNNGPLISPEMVREFLFPYYRNLIENARQRQNAPIRIQIDTDGDATQVIDLYQEIGMRYMSPFEVASGCDVVAVGERYPDLLMLGGFDKRILATDKDSIDREIDRIFPVMRKRGGYIPTVDHGVPEEVSLENYRHFRKRCLEFAT
jgi:uroporphyrinogen-III decarboxylase